MLHRAANNAYSWWWASHIRTKQSKWLDNNLQEMEGKVQYMLKLIDEDGDSFARRAESYYRKRPELISFVEEFYRAYRALAEKYDHISGELQNANHTIATVFPDRVQFAMDEDDETSSPHLSAYRPSDPSKIPKGIPEVPKAVPKFIKNLRKGKGSLEPKIHPKKINSTRTTNSQMSKEEAIQEIDKLQKGILALQTEKEFVKGSYENRLAKYWEIEKSITEMQEKVCELQDEFRVGTLIEDHEARTLMAATALNSCQETLVQLQEKQERSNEEVRVEQERIKDIHNKLEAFKGEFLQNQTGQNPFEMEVTSEDSTVKPLEQEVGGVQQETVDAEAIREKIREQFEIIYGNDLSVSELAEKIDELATKVISLETAVSTQTALIRRLKSETGNLQENLRSLEEDKAALLQDSTKLNEKLKELEGKLHAVQDLNTNVESQNNNLQTHFTEAHCNLDHLSEKLKCVKPDEETETTVSSETEIGMLCTVDSHNKQELGDAVASSEESVNEKGKLTGEEEVQEPVQGVTDTEEALAKSHHSGQPEEVSEGSQETKKLSDVEKSDSSPAQDTLLDSELQEEPGDQEYELNWQQLFSNGLEERERLLLGEYTAIVRKYKETRKQLSELQRNNHDSQFETIVQLRELRNTIAMKDEEIQSLRQKLKSMQESGQVSDNLQQDVLEALSSQSRSDPVVKVEHQPISDSLQDQNAEGTPRSDVSTAGNSPKSPTQAEAEEEEEIKVPPVDEPRPVSTIEEKFRRDIDELLEENLEFWMRFSGLFHQIQKFQTAIKDLQSEYAKLKENKNTEEGSTSSKHSDSLRSDARPIYKHLREIQTELTVWIEKNMLLKDEVKYRLSSLGNIQDEIERVSKTSSGTDEEFTNYQAAKFQGEVLNMEQENNKVADELQAGLEHVKELQVEIEKTLAQMEDELKLSGSRSHHHNVIHSLSRTRIPLRSLLFGVRAKKQKPPSFFACINPTLNKQHSDLDGGYTPL